MTDDARDPDLLRAWDDLTTSDSVPPWVTANPVTPRHIPVERRDPGGGAPGAGAGWPGVPGPPGRPGPGVPGPPGRIVPWAASGPSGPIPGTSHPVNGKHPGHPDAVPAGAPAGAVLDAELLLADRRPRPTGGWRGLLYAATGGHVNPGPSLADARRAAWVERIRTPLPGCHEVTVVSMKGGVGKTTIATLLGLVLADQRGDRVLALDANPDAGTLADRVLGRPVIRTVRDLIIDLDRIESMTDIARYTGLAGRLQVLASEQDPAMSEAFDQREYELVMALLRRFFNVLITDSGTGVVHSAMRGALNATKTLVLVGAPTVDAASRAAKTLDWLGAHGHGPLVAGAVVALSCDRYSRDVDQAEVTAHFSARCRAVVRIPSDSHLATGAHIDLNRLHRHTLDAALELAAAVGDDFGRPIRAGQPPVPPPTSPPAWAPR